MSGAKRPGRPGDPFAGDRVGSGFERREAFLDGLGCDDDPPSFVGSVGRIQPTAAMAIAAAAASQPAALSTALEPVGALPEEGSGIFNSPASRARRAWDSGLMLPATGLLSADRFQTP